MTQKESAHSLEKGTGAIQIQTCESKTYSNITTTGITDPRVDSRLIAQRLGNRHKNVLDLLDKYKDKFARFGVVPFKTEKPKGPAGGRPERFAMLGEDHCYFLLSLSRNTDPVTELKAQLVEAFREARQLVDIHNTEYLPIYHGLHDEVARLAEGSKNQRFVHININKAVNKTVGVRSGERHTLPLPRKALLIVAHVVARNALATAKNHKDGYQAAKVALNGLHHALEVT